MNNKQPLPESGSAAKTACGCRCGTADLDLDRNRFAGSCSGGGIVAVVSSVLFAITPKCPLCWAAYMSAFGSLGVSVQIPYQPWLLPLMGGLLLVNLAALFLRARARGRYSAFCLCLLGGAAIASGKLVFESTPVIVAGLVCIIAGSLWSAAFRVPGPPAILQQPEVLAQPTQSSEVRGQ